MLKVKQVASQEMPCARQSRVSLFGKPEADFTERRTFSPGQAGMKSLEPL